jgi:diadenosine tetraphosphatase ApaH/serine/threonine PP2A family protein phosphatase
VFTAFCDSFSWLPLAAIVNSVIFCVHGGIGPGVHRLEQIENLPRPTLSVRDVTMLHTILWADPAPGIAQYGESIRGGCPSFGTGAAKEFLRVNGCNLIIRAHECVTSGVSFISSMCVATVFSASSYEASSANSSGILHVLDDGTVEKGIFPPLTRLPRVKAAFYSMRQTTAEPGTTVAPVRSATLRFSSSQLNMIVGQNLVRSSSILGIGKASSVRGGLRAGSRPRPKVLYLEAQSSFGELPPGDGENAMADC